MFGHVFETLVVNSLNSVDARVNEHCLRHKLTPMSISVVLKKEENGNESVYIFLLSSKDQE